MTVSGKDGDDVPSYLEKQLQQLLKEIEQIRREQRD